jgi:hypothetical protein
MGFFGVSSRRLRMTGGDGARRASVERVPHIKLEMSKRDQRDVPALRISHLIVLEAWTLSALNKP